MLLVLIVDILLHGVLRVTLSCHTAKYPHSPKSCLKSKINLFNGYMERQNEELEIIDTSDAEEQAEIERARREITATRELVPLARKAPIVSMNSDMRRVVITFVLLA
jgi:hypothetical protein